MPRKRTEQSTICADFLNTKSVDEHVMPTSVINLELLQAHTNFYQYTPNKFPRI